MIRKGGMILYSSVLQPAAIFSLGYGWQCLQIFLTVRTWGKCYQRSMGRCQRCCLTPHTAQNSPPPRTKYDLTQNVSSATAEKLCCTPFYLFMPNSKSHSIWYSKITRTTHVLSPFLATFSSWSWALFKIKQNKMEQTLPAFSYASWCFIHEFHC